MRDRAFLQRSRGFLFSVGSILLGCVALGLFAPAVRAATPVYPTPVPYDQLENDPYRHAGLVRTESYGADPTVLGSGWVAGERVVASAAHVFYVDETLGWNRNRWYWRRAAYAGAYWYTNEMMIPRSYRVLAGYAAAAERTVGNPSTIGDAFNRDSIALLFYRAATNAPAPPRAVDALLGSGTFTIVGYPGRLNGTPVPEIEMYAHQGGLPATFARDGPTEDYAGHPNVLGHTSNLGSGPGNSGGPVYKRINNVWTVVGTLVGGAVDNSSIIVRSVDNDQEAMLTAAINDSVTIGPGEILWEFEGAWTGPPPVFRADGSVIVALNSYQIRAIDAKGAQLWEYDTHYSSLRWIADTNDGRILLGGFYSLIALEGTTGRELMRTGAPYAEGAAVGEIGEVYVSGPNRIARLSPRGTVDWDETLPWEDVYESGQAAPAVGSDGTVYLISQNRLYALEPLTGDVKWRTTPMPGIDRNSVTPGTDGSITVASTTAIARFEPDGGLRWLYPTNGNLTFTDQLVVRGDGSVFFPRASRDGVTILKPDGTEQQTLTMPYGVWSVAVDAAGNLYTGGDQGVRAYSATGTLLWDNSAVAGGVRLGSGGYLLVQGGFPGRTTALGANGSVAPDTWQPGSGGVNGARRAINAPAVAPRIVTPPESTRVVVGYRLELFTEAEGSYPLTFEWRHNGVLLPDHVGQRLFIRETTLADAGEYTVTVRNAAGTATSEPVTVTIGTAQFGDRLWTTSLQSEFPPAVADDGSIYIVHAEGPDGSSSKTVSLVALDPGGNEKWRHELHRGDVYYWGNGPVIGDDGRIYVGTWAKVWAFSPAGAVLWQFQFPSQSSADWPVIALARDNGFFYYSFDRLGCVAPDGTPRWERTGVSRASLAVRRDGALAIAPGATVGYDGVFKSTATGIDVYGGANILGPNDEWVVTTTYTGSVTLNRDGAVVARNFEGFADNPMFYLSDATLVSDRLRVEPFMGHGSTFLPNPRNGAPIAILQGDRILLLAESGRLLVVDRDGTILSEAENIHGRFFTVGPNAVLVGGSPVSAYHLNWPLGQTAWPLPHADARNTRQAPLDFDYTVVPPESVAVRGRFDPTDEYGPWTQIKDGTMDTYAGYSARLTASVRSSGPFTFRWQKNGQVLPQFTGAELNIARLQTADAGDYTVEVTNPAGTVYSSAFTLNVNAPTPAPPGTYVGQWTDPVNPSQTWPCVYQVGGDRTIEFWLFHAYGLHDRTRLNPDGVLQYHLNHPGYNAKLVGTTFTLNDATLAPLAVPMTGTMPNNLPAGIYRGHTLGPSGFPVIMLVLADGTFSWMQAQGAWSRTARGSFSGTSLTTTLTDTSNMAGAAFNITAQTDGAIRGMLQSTYPGLEFTGFSAVWTERPEIERLVNISTRGYVSPDQPPMIPGFVVGGTGEHRFLLRAAGPTLADHGVQQTLAQPRLRLMNQAGAELQQSLAWHLNPDAAEILETSRRLFAFSFGSTSADAALVTTVNPGQFTALVDSANQQPGVALVEVYEDTTTSGGTSRLRNLSTRGTVGSGERVLIGGFVVSGSVPKSMLIRAAGPALAPFVGGAFNVAPDPRLQIFRQGESTPFATNDNVWNGNNQPEVSAAAERVGAFRFAQGSLDAAMVLALEPGTYTAIVDNVTPEIGVALLEIYELPAQ